MIQNRASTKVQKELLLALESARTRLAIAMAAETKSTPLDKWRYYLETTDRICRYIKKLRKEDLDLPTASPHMDQAVESLRRLPVHGKAMRLCQTIQDIVAMLE